MEVFQQEQFVEEDVRLNKQVESDDSSRNSFLKWAKSYKKELIFAGVSIATIIGIIFGIKNKDELTKLWSFLEKRINHASDSCEINAPIPQFLTDAITTKPERVYTLPAKPFDVSRHIRNMPAGHHHSAAKAIEAENLGIILLPNQTIVDPYSKFVA